MYRLEMRLDSREYQAALALRRGRSWRTVFLEGLKIPETPRKLGRPPKLGARARKDILRALGEDIEREAE